MTAHSCGRQVGAECQLGAQLLSMWASLWSCISFLTTWWLPYKDYDSKGQEMEAAFS